MTPTRDAGSLVRVADSGRELPLFDAAGSREIERAALAAAPVHALMERAGHAVARLALAAAPHARQVVVLAGPGNNGGDGLVAARVLAGTGRRVRVVHLLADAARLSADSLAALQSAQAAGVEIDHTPSLQPEDDLVVDALLGLGSSRAPDGPIRAAIEVAHAHGAPILAVDLPTGLQVDTGQPIGEVCVRARWTLSLLTLKPGLFTAAGRDHAGEVWLDDLGVDIGDPMPRAVLGANVSAPSKPAARRLYAQHKGSFGDLWVIGGASGMRGAAVLAARSGLVAGAGRVYLASPDGPMPALEGLQPELMQRDLSRVGDPGVLAASTVVCGCGGGPAISAVLPAVLRHTKRLVLDADALNAIAADPGLSTTLQARGRRGQPTILTPHPLEAARLLGLESAAVQADRLAATKALVKRFAAWVVLKGSGTIVEGPHAGAWINPSGNALLATAGTGDVLAGWLGGSWSAGHPATEPDEAAGSAARYAVWLHGRAADLAAARSGRRLPLTAGALIDAMAAAMPAATR